MQEKIAEEFNQPDYVKISVEQYQKMKETIEIYEITIKAIKEELETINKIMEEFDAEI